MSILAPANLALAVHAPVWTRGAYIGDFTDDCTAYNHTLLSLGGMWSASMTLRQSRARAEQWLDNGLGRHVIIRALGSTEVWSGFVNGIEATIGGYRRTIGPYLDIANRARLLYSYIDTSGDTPILGLRASSDWVGDLDSQDKWGIRERVFSAGGIAVDRVPTIVAMLVERYKDPPRSEEISINASASAGIIDIKLELAGYVQTLENQIYNSTTTGSVYVSAKIQSILLDDSNSAISRDMSGIEENAYPVSDYENDNATAWDLIRGYTAEGDDQLNKYTFGVYADRRAKYGTVDNAIAYLRPLGEGVAIQSADGIFLRPWEVLPGRYVGVSGIVPGRPFNSDLDTDNRILYADSVQFRAPDELVINGAHSFRIERKLAQMGLSGIS